MITYIILALGILAILLAFFFSETRKRHSKGKRVRRKAAKRLQLTWYASDFLKPDRAEGVFKGFPIRIGRSGETELTAIVIDAHNRIPSSLVLSPVRVERDRIDATGDEIFDNHIRVEGDELDTVPVLDEHNRIQVLAEVDKEKTEVRDGKIHWEGHVNNVDQLIGRLKALTKLATSLTLQEKDVCPRLWHNARKDANSKVQLRNKELLVRHFADRSEGRSAARSLLHPGFGDLRLLAAKALGDDEGLRNLEIIVEAKESSLEQRIDALEYLSENATPERVIPLLKRLLNSPVLELRRTAIERLGEEAVESALDRLIELSQDADPDTAVTIAVALGNLGDPKCEPRLIEMLESGPRKVKLAVISALEDMGTVNCVEPLLAYVKNVQVDPLLKRAARNAVLEIQSRLGEAERGLLSIPELQEGEGGLSLASDSGQLSITDTTASDDEEMMEEEET